MAVIGVDLGGTKLAAAAFTDNGDVLLREVQPLVDKDVGALVIRLVRDVISRCEEPVTGVGMCVPGIYYPESGRVWAPNIPGWEEYPLLDLLMNHLDPELDVRVESDRSCYILGEIWKGAAQGCTDAVFMAVGTGIGAGIISGGRIITGRHGIAGAIGWLALDRPFRDGYETWGCFEYHSSGDGLARTARDIMTPEYRGSLRDADPLTGRAVFQAFEEGDPLAAQVIERAIGLWGMAVANLVSLLNPEKIIFGGGVFGPAVKLLDRIGEEARRWGQPISMTKVRLEPAQLGSDAGLYGAARLVAENH